MKQFELKAKEAVILQRIKKNPLSEKIAYGHSLQWKEIAAMLLLSLFEVWPKINKKETKELVKEYRKYCKAI